MISGIDKFWLFWTPTSPPWCPIKSQKLWILLHGWQYQISTEKLFLCANLQLLGGGGGNFREMGNFWLFLSPRFPQNSQNFWFVLNEWQHKICDQKLHLCANFQLLGVIFREMDNFWRFWPQWPLGCPEKGKKRDFTERNLKIKFLI